MNMNRKIVKSLKLWKEKKDRKPLILLGARQVGKTYTLQDFANNFFQKSLYINFEKDKTLDKVFDKDLDPKRILNELQIYLNKEINIHKDLLIFDEIQECAKALTSLKYFSEELPDLAICSCGSLLGIKLSEGSFPVGKVEIINMYPMSFFEFLEAMHEEKLLKYLNEWEPKEKLSDTIHGKTWDLFKEYLITGGLPESVLTYEKFKNKKAEALIKVREIQGNLIRTHLADIAKHSGKQNSMHIERVWSSIPSQLAREQDASSTRYRFKGVFPNIRGYSRLAGSIDWLEASGLILKVLILNSGNLPLKSYTEENYFKLYVYDVGMLGALSDLAPKVILDYEYGTYKGYFAENFVAQEFVSTIGTANKLYAWKEAKSEIEFVRDIDGSIIPIEVKSGWNTRSRSLQVFMEKYKPNYGIIFSANNFGLNVKNKIHKYPVYLASRFP